MNMTDSKFLFDSSAWISYLLAENVKVKGIVESEILLLTSVISIFEIKRKFMRDKYNENKISEVLDFIKGRSIILHVDEMICNKGAEISIEKGLHAIDALIFATSVINKARLLTGDQHFNGLENVEILS